MGLDEDEAVKDYDAVTAYRTADPLAELNRSFVIGQVWKRPGLSVRDRRIATIAAIAGHGQFDYVAHHIRACLDHDELTVAELQELAVQIAVYGGWPLGNKLQATIDQVLEERR